MEQEDPSAEAMAAAKAALLEVVPARRDADAEVAYVLGALYLKQPFDPVLAKPKGGDDPEKDDDMAPHAKVLRDIKDLRKAAARARRDRFRRVTQGNEGAKQKDGVLVSKSASASPIRAGVGDFFQAWRWLQIAAFRGHTGAMVRLGNICIENVSDDRSGGTYNVRLAEKWYIRAAAAPSPIADAMYNLAKLYHEGFQAEDGSGEIREILSSDSVRARFWLDRAAQHGDPTACLWMAHAARVGDTGLGFSGPDRDTALASLQDALSRDAPGGDFYAAQLHRFGDANLGVEADEALFWRYAKQGAKKGDADALFAMADAYFNGTDTVEASLAEAFKYYGLACDAGSGEAAICLGAIFARGVGVKQDYEAAFRYYELAADRGIVLAWQNIASMYALGQGVPQDEQAAKRILETWGPHIQEALQAP
uniref:Uncharacterized protein n=1 Tax=Pinguiococcus pyrenoidosus TaxID=172671 RepID=A0A7R9UGA6_9STRA